MSSIDPSKKLLKSIKEQHAKEKEELKSNYDKIMKNLKIDNDDEYSIADSMFSSAFVNTPGMKDFSSSQQGGSNDEDSMEGSRDETSTNKKAIIESLPLMYESVKSLTAAVNDLTKSIERRLQTIDDMLSKEFDHAV